MSKNRGVVYIKPGVVEVHDIADPKLRIRVAVRSTTRSPGACIVLRATHYPREGPGVTRIRSRASKGPSASCASLAISSINSR